MINCNCAEHLEDMNRQWTCLVHGERVITRPDNWNVPQDDEWEREAEEEEHMAEEEAAAAEDPDFSDLLERMDRSVKSINALMKIARY